MQDKGKPEHPTLIGQNTENKPNIERFQKGLRRPEMPERPTLSFSGCGKSKSDSVTALQARTRVCVLVKQSKAGGILPLK